MLIKGPTASAATTLPELMIAAAVVGVFFASIFQVNAVVLRYISSSKENVSAIECVHDRLEAFRNQDFQNLIDPTYQSVAPTPPPASPAPTPPQRRNLTTPSNASELAQQATEIVTMSTFANGAATTPKVTYTRAAGAKINTAAAYADTNTVPTKVWTGGTTLSGARAVLVDVTYQWNAVLGKRSRSETSSTIIVAGTKK
jgi:type II secretory pathway pseudopilin PulG